MLNVLTIIIIIIIIKSLPVLLFCGVVDCLTVCHFSLLPLCDDTCLSLRCDLGLTVCLAGVLLYPREARPLKTEQKRHLPQPHRVIEMVGLSLWLSLLGQGEDPPRATAGATVSKKEDTENRARDPATHGSHMSQEQEVHACYFKSLSRGGCLARSTKANYYTWYIAASYIKFRKVCICYSIVEFNAANTPEDPSGASLGQVHKDGWVNSRVLRPL